VLAIDGKNVKPVGRCGRHPADVQRGGTAPGTAVAVAITPGRQRRALVVKSGPPGVDCSDIDGRRSASPGRDKNYAMPRPQPAQRPDHADGR